MNIYTQTHLSAICFTLKNDMISITDNEKKDYLANG